MASNFPNDVKAAYAWAKKNGRMTPHLRIMEAARLGRGVRLSADEVDELSDDEAVERAALQDETGTDPPWQREGAPCSGE